MKRLIKYMKAYRKEAVIAPLFKLFEAILELTVPVIVSLIVDNGIARGGEEGKRYSLLMCGLLVLLGLAGLAFSLTAQYFSAKAACGFAGDIRSVLFSRIQSLSFSQLDRAGTGTLITRMTSDVNQVQTGVNLTLRLLLRSPFVVLGALIGALIVGATAPSAVLAFIIVIPVLAIVVMIILLAGIPLYRKAQGGLDGVTGLLRSDLEGERVIRAFRLEDRRNAEFDKRNRSLNRFQLLAGRISGLLNPLTYVIVNLAVILMLSNGSHAVNEGILTNGKLIALYNYLTQILVELIKFANLVITITRSLACADRISAVIGEEPAMPPKSESADFVEGAPAVIFRNVSFEYPGASGKVLESIDLSVKKGEKIGIIGGTGSGKSSLVGLIPRFYDVSEGSVEVGGRDVREYDPDELRRHIGYVAQHATLFRGSIRDNIKWGDPDATDEEITEALKEAQIGNIIEEKKGGLSYMIEQGGRNLSGGQRQRLNVARALVRRPQILVLDDSSSALDRATEASLRRAIRELDYSPAVFIVSQRVESVSGCDRIVVLDGGRAVGIGKHDELYGNCEVYREICDSQKGGESL